MAKSIEERYLAEQKQAEIDHHQPTAGAMADHILANLRVLTNKLVQAAWYVKGPSYFADREYLLQLQATLNHDFVQLGDQLRAVGEKPLPSPQNLANTVCLLKIRGLSITRRKLYWRG